MTTCRLANALSIGIALGFALFLFIFWVRHPTLTQMQVFLRFWPYHLGAVALVVGLQFFCEGRERRR